MDVDDPKATRKLAEDAKENKLVAPQTPTSLVVQGICLDRARLREASVNGDTITVLSDGAQVTTFENTTTVGG